MLEIITAITTSVTAILSVYIAYKSHRTTINERKREKEEFSIKLMELHENKNKQYLNKIYLLSEFDIELDVEQGQQNMIYNFINNKDIYNETINYIGNTEKFKEEKIEQLSLENTRTLSNSISKSLDLLTQIAILEELKHDSKVNEIMTHHHGNETAAYKFQSKAIQKSSKELLLLFKYD